MDIEQGRGRGRSRIHLLECFAFAGGLLVIMVTSFLRNIQLCSDPDYNYVIPVHSNFHICVDIYLI